MARGEMANLMGNPNARFFGLNHQFQPRGNMPPGGQFQWLNRGGYMNPDQGMNQDPEYNNQGMFGVGLKEFANNKEALRKNPYGHATGKDQREPIDDLRMAGFAIDDPKGWGWLQKKAEGYRGPHNPTSPLQSPWNMNKHYMSSGFGIMTPKVLDTMTQPERKAYARKRFTYDTNLRGGLSDETTYERARRIKEETGVAPNIGIKATGNYDKYGNPV